MIMLGTNPTAVASSLRSDFWTSPGRLLQQKKYHPRHPTGPAMKTTCSAAGPKRVAVIGAGPGGLAAALALQRLDTGVEEVQVFEKFPELRPALGAGFNINGGAVILARLGIANKVKEIGNPVRRIRSRACDGTELLAFDLENAVSSFAGPTAMRHEGELCAYTVMRSDLQQVMAAELPEGTIQLGKQLKAVDSTKGGVKLSFEDGAEEEFDLVVAADGIKSRARELMFGTTSPQYSNIRIQFGVCPPGKGPRPPAERQELHQWFGDGAYCLVYTGDSGERAQDMVALVRQESATVAENSNWDTSAVQEDCVARLSQGRFPSEVIDVAQGCERFMDVGVYYHNTLPSWSKDGRVVLLGDAAHAMPPFLGQGANQAIQDAYALADKLSKVGSDYRSTAEALAAYQQVRIPPTAAIMQSSRFLGLLETQGGPGGLLRNSLFFVMGKLRVAEKVFVDGASVRV